MPRPERATPPELISAIAAGEWQRALAIAAKFKHLGDQKAAVLKAWAAVQHPAFYRELGQDPDALLEAGAAALRARFTPPHSKTAHPDAPTP